MVGGFIDINVYETANKLFNYDLRFLFINTYLNKDHHIHHTR
ncbi:hypothetical protein Slin_1906 [Spirosoma linguale DSM 74]|uniref:Uncharacterized protein n=1 Tax=Spirosoma linguale (strain ATCC 33905 / DSM 74 / LMG 10896 / Claus 1) TaxID=504472 RepID=D2QBS2_SPILD|nr:hypothetical protein Slin_1906 [Spirosoma linguale DSM 74]